jgi:hypothetical protein
MKIAADATAAERRTLAILLDSADVASMASDSSGYIERNSAAEILLYVCDKPTAVACIGRLPVDISTAEPLLEDSGRLAKLATDNDVRRVRHEERRAPPSERECCFVAPRSRASRSRCSAARGNPTRQGGAHSLVGSTANDGAEPRTVHSPPRTLQRIENPARDVPARGLRQRSSRWPGDGPNPVQRPQPRGMPSRNDHTLRRQQPVGGFGIRGYVIRCPRSSVDEHDSQEIDSDPPPAGTTVEASTIVLHSTSITANRERRTGGPPPSARLSGSGARPDIRASASRAHGPVPLPPRHHRRRATPGPPRGVAPSGVVPATSSSGRVSDRRAIDCFCGD